MDKKRKQAEPKPEEQKAEQETLSDNSPVEKTPEINPEEKAAQDKELEFKKLNSLLEEQKDKYLRLLAEYDNFRKRSQKERDAIFPEAYAASAAAFLPVLDSLERAFSQETEDSKHKKGIELIIKQFNDSLSKLGIAEIQAQGASFDPEMHNAVQHIEDPELGENTVAEVLQKGFIIGDRVIRHAIVKVAN
ncbi:MAG: nucleotide exchange factor GrpE [Bacillota bacterium]|nr:nucleotide exchange factor GrpE [Bacillota bacterium]